jgi:hypothetical protein
MSRPPNDGTSEQIKKARAQRARSRRARAEAERIAEAESKADVKEKRRLHPESYEDLLKFFREIYRDGEGTDPKVTDAISQALLTVLGSGPSFAALETLVSASQANGLMFQNSVSLQQRTSILGMVATARCVKSLLDLDTDWAAAELEDPVSGL